MPRTGAPTKLNKKKQQAFCEAIKLGLSRTRAARLIGVTMQTIENWCSWGKRDGKGKYFTFLKSVIQSEEFFVEDNLRTIRNAAKGNDQIKETRTTLDSKGKIKEQIVIVKEQKPLWTASAWLLERRCPQEFSQHQIIDDKSAEKVAEDLEDILNGGKNE